MSRPVSRRMGRMGRIDWFSNSLKVWVLLTIVFLKVPFIVVFLNSIGAERIVYFPPQEFSLRWYSQIPPAFIEAFVTSLQLSAVATAANCLLAVPAALGIMRGRLPGRKLLDSFLRSPLQVPMLVTGLAFLLFYTNIVRLTGVAMLNTFAGLAIAFTVVSFPYVFSSVAARLAEFDSSVEEAAYGLGASPLYTFFRVTLPIIKPAIFVGAFFSFMISFDNVPVALFLVGSQVKTFPVELFFAIEWDMSRGIFAVATLATIFSTVLVVFMQRFFGLAGRTAAGG